MPRFKYRARGNDGDLIAGVIEGFDLDSVRSHLDGMGFVPVRIEEVKPAFGELFFERFTKITLEDKIIFSRQFSTLISSGVPILESISVLSEQAPNKKFGRMLDAVRRDIESGCTLEEAMGKFPDAFDGMYLGMVRAGETAGVMDLMFDRLAYLLEHEMDTSERMRAAVSYPKKVMVGMVLAFLILFSYVVPVFVDIYKQFDVELPLATRILIYMNDFFHDYWFLLLLLVVGLVWGTRRYLATKHGRMRWDRCKIKLPVIGEIYLKTSLSRFSRVFAILSGAGLPVLEGLEITAKTVNNAMIANVVLGIRDSVSEGSGLTKPMKISNVFPPVILQMVSVGEETGRVEEMLKKVSEYYDRDVDYALKHLAGNLEPILLLFIAAVLFVLALGVFTPYWNLVNVFRS